MTSLRVTGSAAGEAMDPHSSERMILIGCHQAAGIATAMRILLHPEERKHWYTQTLAFLNDTIKYDSTSCSVFVQPDFKDWPETQSIIALVHAHYKQARINQNTVEAIGARQGLNFVRNLKRVVAAEGRMRDVQHSVARMTERTALVIGAGVSFEDDADLVRAHRGPIIAVNTSAGACAQRDVHPDIVVCTESKPVTEGIARMDHSGSQFAMDLTGSPDNWPNIASESEYIPHPLLCFMGTEPSLIPYARKLRMMPLAYGSSCTTAAVSLALAMGAERVALIGQDCSFSTRQCTNTDPRLVNARMYASGTPYEETRVTIDAVHGRAIIEKPTVGEYEQDVIQVPSVDGSKVWTTHSMLSFAHWFRDQPAPVRDRIVNCTSSGAHIEGLAHVPLASVLQTDRGYGAGDPSIRGQLEALDFVTSARRTLKHLHSLAHHGRSIASDAALLEWSRRHPVLSMWVSPERLRMRRLELSLEERGHRVATVLREACREIVRTALEA